MDITESYIKFLGINFDQFMVIYNNLLQCTAIETGGNLARSWKETKLTKIKKIILSGGNFDQYSAIYVNQEALKF